MNRLLCSIVAGMALFAAPAVASAPVPLNSASVADFAGIDGVDAATANRIVALRAERGDLGSVEALRILDLPADTLDALRSVAVVDLPVKRASGKKYKNVDEVLAEFSSEPNIRAVQSMAMEYTKTHPRLVEGWMRSAKAAYLLPRVDLAYRKELDQSDKDRWDLDDEGEYSRRDYEQTGENDDTYAVGLQWRLDKLIMSSEQIRVINESQDAVKLRDKVLDEITRLYFDRRRLQVDLLLNPAGDIKKQMEDELRLQELSANIDALTGGAFSASVK
jgi:hypothetical protein